MPLYPYNTIRWTKGDLVLHMHDAKEPKMLMEVIGYTRDGLCKTKYLDNVSKPRSSRTTWKNEIKYLLDPVPFLPEFKLWGARGSGELLFQIRTGTLQKKWELLRWWIRHVRVGTYARYRDAGRDCETQIGSEPWCAGLDPIVKVHTHPPIAGGVFLEYLEPNKNTIVRDIPKPDPFRVWQDKTCPPDILKQRQELGIAVSSLK